MHEMSRCRQHTMHCGITSLQLMACQGFLSCSYIARTTPMDSDVHACSLAIRCSTFIPARLAKCNATWYNATLLEVMLQGQP